MNLKCGAEKSYRNKKLNLDSLIYIQDITFHTKHLNTKSIANQSIYPDIN